MSSKRSRVAVGAAAGDAAADDAKRASAGASCSSSSSPPSVAAAAAAPSETALVRRRRGPGSAAGVEGGGAATMSAAVGITAAEMRRFVGEQLRSVRHDLDRVTHELSAVRRDHARELSRAIDEVRRDHARELSDLRYDNARLGALLDSSGVASEVGMVCRRGGGAGPDGYVEVRSVLSVLFGYQEYEDLKDGLMRFFDTREARELRLVHSEFLDAVAATPWHDTLTAITGPIASWRASFPNAQAAMVFEREDLVDADFVYFRGLRTLEMSDCTRPSQVAFANLRGIDRLSLVWCELPEDAADFSFAPFKGIQELDTLGCTASLDTAAFFALPGVRSLGFLGPFFRAINAKGTRGSAGASLRHAPWAVAAGYTQA